MKNQMIISCISVFLAAISSGCMPMMMMDGGSEHSKTHSPFETVTRIGSLRAKVVISPLLPNKESTISVELTNAETGQPFETAEVQCLIEHTVAQSHEGHANTGHKSGGDSLQVERHEKTHFEKNSLDFTDPTSPPLRGEGRRGLQHWLTMEMSGSGFFNLKYTPLEQGSYRIQVRISDVEGIELKEPVIIDNTLQTTNHAETSMSHGMMGRLGDYGIVATIGLVTVMVAVMAFRWF
ncbi:MAG: hypothetical protein HYY49_04185 [Ignavibacteriales bacterium]|nr:hypothetical protein [Ignavibacteriales bacterium]